MKKIQIYIATHKEHIDGDEIHYPIQVGAALNDLDIQELKDNSGDNISEKNASYCELTALYWIWKNSTADIVGLEHYRRRFTLSKQAICQIMEDYDMILPGKYAFRMSLEKEYREFHISEDWNRMKHIIEKKYPEYIGTMEEVFGDNKLVPYNMFIVRKKLCEEYCTWLFNILTELEKQTPEEFRDKYQMRYLGFLSERLLTLYVRHNHIKVYTGQVMEREHQSVFYQMKNWFGQNFFNPFIFNIRER